MLRQISAGVLLAVALTGTAVEPALAQQGTSTYGDERAPKTRARPNDAYRPGPDQPGLGVLGPDGRAAQPPAYGSPAPYAAQPTSPSTLPSYGGPPSYSGGPVNEPPVYGAAPSYGAPPAYGSPQQGGQNTGGQSYGQAGGQGYGSAPVYQAPYGRDGRATYGSGNDAYRPPVDDRGYAASNNGGFGQPYSPPAAYDDGAAQERRPYAAGAGVRDLPPGEYRQGNSFSLDEIKNAGHGFFGSISQGLASVIEHATRKKGRPNGYILGEEAGGAFIGGLRYGRGRLYTKDAGVHNVYWQGPSIGFDAGADGSKVMILVYNLRDVGDVFERYGGIDGSAYVVGGVGMTFMSRDHVIMAPIRSGVGLRFGANVGYLKFTSQPTWNPF